jgi:hypothetical protein
MDSSNNVDLENLKLQREIEKLEAEINSLRPAQIRAWVTSLSVIVGIIVSVAGLILTLSEIKTEYKIKSREILVNDLLDKISGVKVYHLEKTDGKLDETRREMYGATVQRAAYAASLSIAKEISHLKPIVVTALEQQLGTADTEIVEQYLIELGEKQVVERYRRKLAEQSKQRRPTNE